MGEIDSELQLLREEQHLLEFALDLLAPLGPVAELVGAPVDPIIAERVVRQELRVLAAGDGEQLAVILAAAARAQLLLASVAEPPFGGESDGIVRGIAHERRGSWERDLRRRRNELDEFFDSFGRSEENAAGRWLVHLLLAARQLRTASSAVVS